MRAIQFPSGTRESTKETTAALAWAFNRRGGARNGWRSENVVRSILQYLREHNVDVPDATHLSNVMHLLVSWGYAERRMSDTGRRTVEFKFNDDVNLTGYSPKTRLTGSNSTPVPRILAPTNSATLPPSHQRPQPETARSQFGPRVHPPIETDRHTVYGGPEVLPLPPLPFNDRELLPPLYRFDELEVELREWCESEEGAEAYAMWVDAVIEQFRRKKEINT